MCAGAWTYDGMVTAASKAGALATLRAWARQLKRDTYALYLAARDPRTPWYAKAVAALVAAYAFSPIDLIPDFIPVLGYLDDVILVPLGIYLALKMVPPDVMAECRARAEHSRPAGKPKNWLAAAAIMAVWLLALAAATGLALRALR